jgi:hypothetical protein
MGFGGFCPLPLRLGGDSVYGWTAPQHARVCADMVSSKRAQPLAWITYSHVSSTITIEAFHFIPGSSAAFRPTATHISTGISEWALVPAQSDAYDMTQQVVVRHVIASAHHTGTCRCLTIELTTPTLFYVRLSTATGAVCNGRATVALW